MQFFKRPITVYFLIGLLLSVSSCAPYLNDYSSAQESFNEAARMDNELKLKKNIENFADLISPESQVRIKYLTALEDIDNVIKSGEAKLEADGLLASAYTIKALCEWKVEKYKQSEATARKGLEALAKAKSAGQDVPPRDSAILMAIPGLIKADQAAKLVKAPTEERNYQAIEVKVNSGINDLDAALKSLPKGHPVKKYLLSSKLAILESWLVASADLKGQEGKEASQKIMKMQEEVRKEIKG
ncbi:hypothetical protein [Chondrinema litorale]|uniref:hypothetical protein n=1 Tax=Chondrinema litorale TaxID=2994555 RepID=UPI002542D875|nr:hypothetical protein [Chondrinema litorale]UZR94645.1 hypothetical protein OQ292_02280 [Chondrinema litorale]